MNKLLVLARYNENVDWIRYTTIPHIVYNKGSSDLPDWVNQKKIENISYEEYAYLSYIVDNYDYLADRVIFSQANPFEHSPDFLHLLKYTNLFSDIQPLSWQYLDGDPPEYLKVLSKKYLLIKNYRVHVEFISDELFRYDAASGTFMSHRFAGCNTVQIVASYFLKNDNVRVSALNLLDLPNRKFGNHYMTPICYGAIFSVTKQKILSRPKEYYLRLLELSKEWFSTTNTDPAYKKAFAYLMEFMWLELFGYDPPKELYAPNPLGEWWSHV
jgi:hypothetical protein